MTLDLDLHLGFGQLSAASAIACTSFVGYYLFCLGVADLEEGLHKSGRLQQCQSIGAARTLRALMPVTCLVRVLLAPALWYHLAEQGSLLDALESPPVLCWIVLYFVPLAMFFWSVFLNRGIRDIHDAETAIRSWPEDMLVERPSHGLYQTRCVAVLVSFIVELVWNGAILHCGNDGLSRVGCISASVIIWNFFMLSSGPIQLLSKSPGDGCKDSWIAQGYLLVSILICELMILLNHAWFGLPQVMHGDSHLGPYSHWSTLVWLALAAAQAFVLHFLLLRGVELVDRYKGPAPYLVGTADFKEFFCPPFWSLVLYCRVQFFAFNFWIIGCYVWSAPGVRHPS